MIVKFDPRIFNPIYWHLQEAIADPDIRFIFLMGGSSSGKTYSVSQAEIINTLATNNNTLMMRKCAVDIKDSIYSDAKTIGLKINKFTNNFDIIQNEIRIGSGKLRFRGLDDSERIKGISNYIRVCLDEITEYKEDDFKQVKKRLRGRPNQKIIATWNPISRNHWIKKNVIDKESWVNLPLFINAPKCNGVNLSQLNNEFAFKKKNTNGNTIFIKNTYRDNFWVVGHPAGSNYGFYDKHIIADFERDKIHDINNYNIYANGDWGVISDRLIMKNWSVIDKIPEGAKQIPSGMDFGFNPDPLTLTDFHIHGDTMYWDERIHETGLTNLEVENPLQDSIIKRLKDINFNPDQTIIADSAEPKSIRELRCAGYNVRAVKKPRIAESLKWLLSYNHKVTARSKNIINEFENYQRQIDRGGIILPEPIDEYNHHIDPARYVLAMKDRLW